MSLFFRESLLIQFHKIKLKWKITKVILFEIYQISKYTVDRQTFKVEE